MDSEIISSAGFAASGSSIIDPFFQLPIVTGSVTYNQTSGTLNIVSDTNANSEFLAISRATYSGTLRNRFAISVSSRIANSNFAVILADLIGSNVRFTVVSSTQVNVNLPNHGFTSGHVGQSIFLGAITGLSGAIPGKYTIGSIIDSNNIQVTVSGWPSSGTGFLTIFGRNYIRNLFTGTVATRVNVDGQQNGWATGDTLAVINTTASVGTVIQVETTGRELFWSDSLRASTLTPAFTTRASRYENIPEPTVPLYVFLWSYNGSTAPASAVTFSLSHLSVEQFDNKPVYIQGSRSLGDANPIPVRISSGGISGATSLNVQGAGASGSAVSGNPVRIAGSDGTNTRDILTDTNGNLFVLGAPQVSTTDIASAAITTTTTTATITPSGGNSYSVSIPVTAVSGTNPTFDVEIQESDDTGTNWQTIYQFPRITATGIYRSPKLSWSGNRIRYVQTIGGTTPSFTRSVIRLSFDDDDGTYIRQRYDRSVSLTTLNATTVTLAVPNTLNAQLVVNIGAATTAPVFQLEGSSDGGATWYSIGSTLTSVASSTVQQTYQMIGADLIRARVSTAGATVTPGFVMLKGYQSG